MRSPNGSGRPLQGAPRGVSARESEADANIVGGKVRENQAGQEFVEGSGRARHRFVTHCELLMVDAAGAAAVSGLSERTWWRLDRSSRLPRAIAVGRRRLWRVEELRGWVAAGCPARDQWDAIREGQR